MDPCICASLILTAGTVRRLSCGVSKPTIDAVVTLTGIEKDRAGVKAFRYQVCFSAARTFDAVFAEFPSSTAQLA